MKKFKLLQDMEQAGVVAVLRGSSAEEVEKLAEFALDGGIHSIEITMTVPFALRAIEHLAAKYAGSGAIIGAGTVLDAETARLCILHGAEFVVGPSLNPETVRLCNRYRIPIMPGAVTIQEIQSALELGVDVVKLFPGNMFSPQIIKAIKGPLPQANIMPTGGVSLDNLGDWVAAGVFAVGIGSDLTTEAVKTGNYRKVTEKAEQYMQAYQAARNELIKERREVSPEGAERFHLKS